MGQRLVEKAVAQGSRSGVYESRRGGDTTPNTSLSRDLDSLRVRGCCMEKKGRKNTEYAVQ